MNKKWSEKTTFEKTLEIISLVALVVWLVFEILEYREVVPFAGMATSIALSVVCVCQAILFWNEKRALSIVAIVGAILIITTMVLQIVWFA